MHRPFRIIERIGAVPQNIPGGNIYPAALVKGTIAAAAGPRRRHAMR
jgi:TRAP-type mannitol/chloroaromatic compound transport system substrate-binding protein